MNRTPTGEVRVIASPQNWIEGSALQQLEKTAALPGIRLAVGLPDLHPGKGSPIGAAFVSEGWIYPALVGNDIGCGIGLWRTALSSKGNKRQRWDDQLRHLDNAWAGDAAAFLGALGIEPSGHEDSLGTIGGGNHFAELQVIEEIVSDAVGLSRDNVYLCIHSGSRGFGEAVLRRHVDQFAFAGIESANADEYLAQHDHAKNWAAANRQLISQRFLECLKTEGVKVVDICHNSVERQQFDGGVFWIHRKGAAPSNQGLAVIPGSRGALSFLVQPKSPTERSAFSLAHGAGRKWSRSDCRGRLEKRFTAKDLLRTELGSQVICEDKDLLYEEAPQAYKNINIVINDLVEAGLVDVVATLKPLLTYKVRRREQAE